MSVYRPADGIWVGRPPCANCGAARRLHGFGIDHKGVCPEAYRPDTLSQARRELQRAEASGDSERVFAARGEVQRLTGR